MHATRRECRDPLEIEQRQVADVTVLDLKGNMTSPSVGVLRKCIQRSIEEGKTRVLLNFAELNYMDSSGVGEVVASLVTIERVGGQLRLVHVPPKVDEIFGICDLYKVFKIYDDEACAITTFSA